MTSYDDARAHIIDVLVTQAQGFLALLVLALTGCTVDYTRSQPRENDLAGKWVLTPASIADMSKRGKYAISQHEVVLNPDHTFSATGIPDWALTIDGRSHKNFKAGSGAWSVSPNDYDSTRYVVKLNFYRTSSLTFHIVHKTQPYLLRCTLGDPDDGTALVLERVEDASK